MKAVALRAGKSQQWLSDRLHGHAPIYADDIYLLAKGLQRDPCDFYASDVEPSPVPSREDRQAPSYLDPDVLADKFMDITREDLELLLAFVSFWKARQMDEQEV